MEHYNLPHIGTLASIHTYIHTYMHTYIRTCIHACIHAYIHAYMYVCMYVFMYVCLYICLPICIHVYIHAYMYSIHTYIHIYTCILVNVCSDEKTPASKPVQRGGSFMLQRPEYIITYICKCALGTGYSSTKMKHSLFMPESLNSTLWSS